MKLKIVHFIVTLIVISIYFFLSFQLVDILKLDDFEIKKIGNLVDVIILGIFYVGLLLTGLLGFLLGFIVIAKVLKVPKKTTEEVFFDNVKLPKGKQRNQKKGFYQWAIDKAYEAWF